MLYNVTSIGCYWKKPWFFHTFCALQKRWGEAFKQPVVVAFFLLLMPMCPGKSYICNFGQRIGWKTVSTFSIRTRSYRHSWGLSGWARDLNFIRRILSLYLGPIIDPVENIKETAATLSRSWLNLASRLTWWYFWNVVGSWLILDSVVFPALSLNLMVMSPLLIFLFHVIISTK